MAKLESVLKQSDGEAYYPDAMDLLLSIKDKKAFELAEGILNKEGFQRGIDWDYNLNFIKKLLLLKSDYTFNFISKKLNSFTPEETKLINANSVQMNMLMINDVYVLAVDKLKDSKPGYNAEADTKTRVEYRRALGKWFNTQYNLLKEGKPNELHLNIIAVNAPVTFVDTPN